MSTEDRAEVLLRPLDASHAASLLAFETANRAYFARSISERGDEYFADFDARLDALLDDQDAGGGAYYVVVDPDDGAVLGRFNLILVGDGTATLGYRVAEAAAGRGLATRAVGELCAIAAARHGLRLLRAATSHTNLASRGVLLRNGFVEVGPAGPGDLGGRSGSWYERSLRGPDTPGRQGR